MQRQQVLVINPNSNKTVTAAMDRALAGFRLDGGPMVDCVTLTEGPLGIETQADVESVTLSLHRLVAGTPADAYVIACYSDPGLHVCREAVARPVLGIAECAMLTALAHGDRFGVIAILDRSIPRHRRYMRQLGLLDRLASERALGLRVHELADPSLCRQRLQDTARALVDDGADTIILGCAGMADYRAELEDRLRLPVIDPTQAAVGMALSQLLAARAAAARPAIPAYPAGRAAE